MGFLEQLSHLETSQICGPLFIVDPLSLVNQWHSEAATWAPDMVTVIYHGSAYARDFLVQRELFYTDQCMKKVSASKLKRQHITKVIAQKYYNALFSKSCSLIIISFSLAYYLLNNNKISSR